MEWERPDPHNEHICPHENTEKVAFWKTLLETIENDESLRPDVVMGDFNLVENPEIDRLNNRRGADPPTARDAMSHLVIELNLANGWRRRNPKKRGYTFTGNSQSRLDRIYTKEDTYPWCTDWKIEHPGFRTDHKLVSVQSSSENMPFIERGRWAIPINLLKHKELKRGTQKLARELQAEVDQATPGGRIGDLQRALKIFKTKVVKLYKDHQTLGTNSSFLTQYIVNTL